MTSESDALPRFHKALAFQVFARLKLKEGAGGLN